MPIKGEVTYQEFVVLDSAGRPQIPKELREQMGIGKRAQMELGDDCIIIRSVVGQDSTQGAKHLTLEEQIAFLFEEIPTTQREARLFSQANKAGAEILESGS